MVGLRREDIRDHLSKLLINLSLCPAVKNTYKYCISVMTESLPKHNRGLTWNSLMITVFLLVKVIACPRNISLGKATVANIKLTVLTTILWCD